MVGIVLAGFSALGFGGGAVLARVGLQYMPTLKSTWLSLVSGFVFLGVIAAGFHFRAFASLPASAIFWFGVIGVLAFPVGRVFYFLGMRKAGVTRAAPIVGSAPIFATIFAVAFLREKITPLLLLGTLSIVGGLAIITSRGKDRTKAGKGLLIGYIAAYASAIAYGLSIVLTRKYLQGDTPPLVGAVLSTFFGSLFLLPFLGRDLSLTRGEQRRGLLWVLASGVVTSVGIAFFYSALSRAPVVVVSPVYGSWPLVALVFSHFFLERLEKVTLPIATGALLVAGGVTLVTVGQAIS